MNLSADIITLLKSSLVIWFLSLVFLLPCRPLLGQTSQELPPYTIPDTEVRTLESKYVENMTYKIDIAFSESYSTSEKNYPTLYVLDAWFYYGIVVQTYRALRILEEVPEILIVGISHFGKGIMDDIMIRSRDYTPSQVDSSLFFPITGGAPQFQKFISQELFPFIDSNYRMETTHRFH